MYAFHILRPQAICILVQQDSQPSGMSMLRLRLQVSAAHAPSLSARTCARPLVLQNTSAQKGSVSAPRKDNLAARAHVHAPTGRYTMLFSLIVSTSSLVGDEVGIRLSTSGYKGGLHSTLGGN